MVLKCYSLPFGWLYQTMLEFGPQRIQGLLMLTHCTQRELHGDVHYQYYNIWSSVHQQYSHFWCLLHFTNGWICPFPTGIKHYNNCSLVTNKTAPDLIQAKSHFIMFSGKSNQSSTLCWNRIITPTRPNPCDFSVGLFQDRVIQKNMQTIHELKTIISSKFNGFLWLL
jgi:hypothetical protein